MGDPAFGPCVDDYQYALHTRHEALMVPPSHHLSLKYRNSPQTMIAQTSRKSTERAFN